MSDSIRDLLSLRGDSILMKAVFWLVAIAPAARACGADPLYPQYPELKCPCVPATSLPQDVFQAVYKFPGQPGQFGNFTVGGPLPKTMRSLPSNVQKVAVSDGGYYFGMGNHEVYRLEPDLSGAYALSPSVSPVLSWTMGITYDSQRDRFLIATLGGEGYLYGFRPNGGRAMWNTIHSLENVDLRAIAYLPNEDRLFGVTGLYEGSHRLFEYDPATGESLRSINTTVPVLDGTYSFVSRVAQLYPIGDYLAFLQYPERLGNPDQPVIHVIDPDSGESWLVVPEPTGVGVALVGIAALVAIRLRGVCRAS
jgi:hypothetical protein